MSGVHFILTGGTINKAYNPSTEKPEISDAPIIADYIHTAVKPHFQTSFETVCLKDSLDMNDQDRADILRAVQNAAAQKIIIVHGTSTMTITQDYLAGKTEGKTIILMGAMIPLKEFAMSDGGFNLGYALAEAAHLPAGVYICMNAKTFTAGNVLKNHEASRFEDSPGRS
jgi:L-asparaginase